MTDLYRPPVALRPTPAEVAQWVGGELHDPGNAPDRLEGFSPLATALPSEISFISDLKRIRLAADSRAGLLLTPRGAHLDGRARVEVDHVWTAVAELMGRLYPEPAAPEGIHPTASVDPSAEVGAGVSIGAGCWVGPGVRLAEGVRLGANCSIDAGCSVGAGSRLHAGVSLQGIVRIGRGVIIHSGCTIGADGFKYEAGKAGILKIPQVGIVVIEDQVEIGANTTIDRAFVHETRIGYGTKIDNQVQIGHNCNVGRFCIICGCVGMAGSVTLGDGCIVGGAVSFRDGITIGPGSQIAGASAVGKDLPAGSIVGGMPAFAAKEWIRSASLYQRLPELSNRLRALEKAVLESREPKHSKVD